MRSFIEHIIFSLLGSQLPINNPFFPNHAIQERKSIAIVGAGPAGLAMLKTLLDIPEYNSWNIVLFEERENVGGIWLPDPHPEPPPTIPKTPVYPSLHSITPIPMMTFPNLPFPAGTHLYPSHEHLEAYLVNYSHHYNLLPHIWFNHLVLNASWLGTPDAGVWNLTFTNHRNETHHNTFHHLIDASGKHQKPQVPSWPGQDEWLAATKSSGAHRTIVHSAWYRDPEAYRNKSLLIVGDSVSGRDLAAKTAPLVSNMFVSIRTVKSIREKMFGPLPANATKKPAISHFTRNSVVFVDDTEIEVDAVLLATGYEMHKYYLEEGRVIVTDRKVSNETKSKEILSNTRYLFPLYKHTFSLSQMYPPTALSFVGLPAGNGTWHANVAESLFIAHNILNPAMLPTRSQMLHELAQDEQATKSAGIDLYHFGPILFYGDFFSDYQDALVDYLKKKGAIKDDGKTFVEPWRREVYRLRYLKWGWKRIEELGTGDEWVEGVSTEEDWLNLTHRVDLWERIYEERHTGK